VNARFTADLSDAEYYAAVAEAKAAGIALGEREVRAGKPFGPVLIRPGRMLHQYVDDPFVVPSLAAFDGRQMFVIAADDSVVLYLAWVATEQLRVAVPRRLPAESRSDRRS
jgi:hypothetical protein